MSVKKFLNQNSWAWMTTVVPLMAMMSACDARTSVRGTVVDADGKPVAGAEVRFVSQKSGRSDATQTDQQGSFICGITHGPAAGKFELSVSKPGYGTYRKQVDEKAAISEKIVLTKEPKAPGS